MTETSHLTAQEMQNQIAELESENKALARRVLGLREALAEVVRLSDRKHDAWDRAHIALNDTAQAGREAEARIKAEAAEQLGSDIGEMVFDAHVRTPQGGLCKAADHCQSYANRLRNGGSDGE